MNQQVVYLNCVNSNLVLVVLSAFWILTWVLEYVGKNPIISYLKKRSADGFNYMYDREPSQTIMYMELKLQLHNAEIFVKTLMTMHSDALCWHSEVTALYKSYDNYTGGEVIFD